MLTANQTKICKTRSLLIYLKTKRQINVVGPCINAYCSGNVALNMTWAFPQAFSVSTYFKCDMMLENYAEKGFH